MKHKNLSIGIVLGLLMNCAIAQTPSGALHYEITANMAPLWNLSGTYAAPYLSNTNGSLILHHAANGKVDGSEILVSDAFPNLEEIGSVSGSLRNGGSNIVVRLSCTAYQAQAGGTGDHWLRVLRKDRLSLALNTESRSLSGMDRGSATFEDVSWSSGGFWEGEHVVKLGTSSFVVPVTIELPAASDGNWTIDLNVVADANKLTGTATITCSNGRVFQFQLKGAYSPKTGNSKLLLTGIGGDKGAHLTLSLGADLSIEAMTGTVAGQRIRVR